MLTAYNRISRKIMRCETPTTHEWVGAHLTFKDLNEVKLFKLMKVKNYDKANKVVLAIFADKLDEEIKPYIISDYADILPQIVSIVNSIDKCEKPIQSRQFIITFKPLHCFQSIQFLIRSSGITVISAMRSCNFIDNFWIDLYLSYSLGELLLQMLKVGDVGNKNLSNVCTNPKVCVIMNIGSLHIFK